MTQKRSGNTVRLICRTDYSHHFFSIYNKGIRGLEFKFKFNYFLEPAMHCTINKLVTFTLQGNNMLNWAEFGV